MEECPRADYHPVKSRFTVDYDSHYGQKACHVDGCTTLVNDDGSYSYLKHDYKRKVVERVKVVDGIEKEVMYTHNLD